MSHEGDGEGEGLLHRFDDLKHRIEDAAIQAEFETGEREETVEEAKAHALVRFARMTLGTIVVIIGIAALPLPGPGWLIIAAGLSILAKDVAWADRLLRYIRKRVPGIPEDGKIPRSSMVTMAVITLAAVSASLWWTLARGSDEIQAGDYAVVTTDGAPDVTPDFIPAGVVTITTDGPITVAIEGCDRIDIAVEEREKTEFDLGSASGTCDTPDGALVDLLANGHLELNHSTDGIVGWFLADDKLTELGTDSGQTLAVERTSSG